MKKNRFLIFSETIQILANRLLGPFDIEAVVGPIGLKISDAIMIFQNSGYDVTAKVFKDCGEPRLQKRQVPIIIYEPKSNSETTL